MNNKLQLVIPDVDHEEMYTKMMDLWEDLGEKIEPQLLSRYSSKTKENVSYAKWLEWCEDDRTTGSNLSTKIPCTLYFLIEDEKEIIGTIMLELVLEKCREMGFKNIEIVPYKENIGAVKTILKNGGVLLEEFCEEGVWSQRYEIQLGNLNIPK